MENYKLDNQRKRNDVKQSFDNKDYEYTYNEEEMLVEEVECGDIQDRINSCNYTSLDKLYDKFLKGEDITPYDAMSIGNGVSHTPNKLDKIQELEDNIYMTASNLGIEYDDETTLDSLMDLIYAKVNSDNVVGGNNEKEKEVELDETEKN